MQVVKAERWHMVERGEADGALRRCSVCGSLYLTARGEPVIDGSTLTRYRVLRCEGCGYDLLEPLTADLALTRR